MAGTEFANPQVALNAIGDQRNFVEANLAEDTTLRPGQRIVFCTANTASDDWTLTLPPVSQCQGMFFYIYATIANSKSVTVEDNSDDAGFTDVVLNTDGDHLLLFSTGKTWIKAVDGEA